MRVSGRGTVAKKLRWDHAAIAAILAVMSVIAFLNILGRYLFHYSLAFTEEITINLFVWLTVLGSGIAFERGSQLGMRSLYNRFPAAARRAADAAGAVLGCLLFAAVDILVIRMIYYEITLFRASSPALGIPVWIYYVGVPLFSVSVFRGIYLGARSAMNDNFPIHSQ